jgi:hypothetical protein
MTTTEDTMTQRIRNGRNVEGEPTWIAYETTFDTWPGDLAEVTVDFETGQVTLQTKERGALASTVIPSLDEAKQIRDALNLVIAESEKVAKRRTLHDAAVGIMRATGSIGATHIEDRSAIEGGSVLTESVKRAEGLCRMCREPGHDVGKADA